MNQNEPILNLLTSIDKKLSLIIGEQIKSKYPSVKDQVLALNKAGFDNKEIANALGITQNHAAKEVSVLKKGQKEKVRIKSSEDTE